MRQVQTTYLQVLPFLVIENDLNTEIYIKLKHRKTEEMEEYSIPAKARLPILANTRFDFYMKQFTFAVMILPTSEEQHQEHHQEHTQQHGTMADQSELELDEH